METRESTTTALLIVCIALFVAGMFFSVLLLPSIGIGIVAGLRSMRATPATLLVAASVFAILAGIGFVMLVLSWGRLEYGLLGYLILWGPAVAAACAAALFVASFRVR